MTTTTPIKISNQALAARSIRNELKKIFPSIKFSVTSKSYAGGDSVSIHWYLGPTSNEVDSITDKYQHGSFDGMIDLYTYKTTNFHEEFGSAKYVQTSRSISTLNTWEGSLYETIARDICALQGVEYVGQYTRGICGNDDCFDAGNHVNQLMSQTSFKAGEVYKGLRFRNETEPMFDANGRQVWLVIEKEVQS